jgi:predicted nucleotidyltransferase
MKKFLLKENYSSPNLFNKINLLNEEQISKISKGIGWTLKYYPSAVLIGGTALVYYLHGGRNLTPDLDFMVDNLSKLKNILDDQDILYRPVRDVYNNVMGITVDEFNVDYLDSSIDNPILNKLILLSSRQGIIGGYRVKIINPELLAIMKLELSRQKDIEDGFALIQSGILNKENYLKYLKILKNTLQDYEALLGYAEMLK